MILAKNVWLVACPLFHLVAVVAFWGVCCQTASAVTYTCYAKFQCTGGGTTIVHRVPGTGDSETNATAAALANANTVRQMCLAIGRQATSPVADGCDAPPPMVVDPNSKPELMIMLAYECSTKNGNRVTYATYGPAAQRKGIAAIAWQQLVNIAEKDGGAAFGSGAIRVENMYVYRAYQTVRSKNNAKKIHREFMIEGKGDTEESASQSAADAAASAVSQLKDVGEEVQLVGTPRVASLINSCHGHDTALAYHQCNTDNGWTIVANYYESTKAEALAAAKATAFVIANGYGATVSNGEISPGNQP